MKKLVTILIAILIILLVLVGISFLNLNNNGWNSNGWEAAFALSILILPYYIGFLLLLAAIWIIAYVLKHV